MPHPQDSQYSYNYAVNFHYELIQEITKYADHINENNDPDSAILKYRLLEAIEKLQLNNAGDLYNHLKEIMNYECRLYNLGIATTANQEHSVFEGKVSNYLLYARNIELKFNELKAIFNEHVEELRGLDNNSFDTEMLNFDDLKIAEIARDLQCESNTKQMTEKRKLLLDFHEQFVKLSHDTTNEIISNHLESWKQHQKKKFVSGNAYVDLNKIQKWCELIAAAICKVKEQIIEFETFQQNLFSFDANFQPVPMRGTFDKLNEIYFTFVKSSIIIEEMPSQVIKIGNKVKTKLRLLVGKGFIDAGYNPEVSAIIVSIANAREVEKQGTFRVEPCGELLNATMTMAEYTTKDYRANFENLKVMKIDRKSKRDVTDEKFAIIFKTTLKIDKIDVSIKLISLPIVITVHVSQETNALATIIWDSWFSEREEVTWTTFSDMLKMMFKHGTGRGLSDENLHFIAEKLFNREIPYPFPDIFANDKVTFQTFCKEKNDRQHTFWEWFYLCFKLINEHLGKFWEDGFIEGFLSRKSIERKLRDRSQGTFIVRFSDSIKSAISIAYVTRSLDGKPLVNHLSPCKSEDLKKKSLSDMLNGYDELKTLFPDIDKKEVFKTVQKNVGATTQVNGYWTPIKSYRLPNYEESVPQETYYRKKK